MASTASGEASTCCCREIAELLLVSRSRAMAQCPPIVLRTPPDLFSRIRYPTKPQPTSVHFQVHPWAMLGECLVQHHLF